MEENIIKALYEIIYDDNEGKYIMLTKKYVEVGYFYKSELNFEKPDKLKTLDVDILSSKLMFYCSGEYNINKPENKIIIDLTWFSTVIIFKELGRDPISFDDADTIVKTYITSLANKLCENL